MLGEFVLGLLTNWASEWLKSIKGDIAQLSWEQSYVRAFQAAIDAANARDTKRPADEKLSLNPGAFQAALRQDLRIGGEGDLFRRLREVEFAAELARAVEQRRAIEAGTLQGEDYRQQVKRLAGEATALYMAAVLSDQKTADRFQAGLGLETLSRLAEIEELVGEDLSRRTAQRLRAMLDYLRALGDRCARPGYIYLQDRLPKPTVAIYVTQQQQEIPNRSMQGAAVADQPAPMGKPETPEEALTRHRHILVEGGPGLGKSTMLAHLALGQLRMPFGSGDVPVLVRAPDLVPSDAVEQRRTFSEAVAAAAKAAVGMAAFESLPPDFFAEPPYPGGGWLVLVDALDEVMDERKRRDLLEAIGKHSGDDRAGYRYVLTSRPLAGYPGLELWRFARYALQPFGENEMQTFAENWFKDRADAQSDDARQLLRRVEDSRLADLGKIPLLLTLAAVVYEEDRDKPLPATRAELYQRFVKLLLEGKKEKSAARSDFGAAWRREWGETGAELRDELFKGRRRLLQHLALWQQEGNTGSLLDEAVAYVAWERLEVEPLSDDDTERLREPLASLIEQTGLLRLSTDQETWLHPTFREFVAALEVATKCQPDSEMAWAFVSRWQEDEWSQVVLFMLGVWDLGLRTTKKADITGLVSRTFDLSDPDSDTIEVLAELGRTAELLTLARDERIWNVDVRRSATEALAELDRVDDLLTLAHDERVDNWVRADAAAALARLGRAKEVIPILVTLARDEQMDSWVRADAAAALARLGRAEEVIPILVTLARDEERAVGLGTHAVEALARLGRVDDLLTLACGEQVVVWLRAVAAEALARLGRAEEGTRILLALAGDEQVDVWVRTHAVGALAELGRVDDLLTLARDERVDVWVRREAAQALARRGRAEEVIPILVTLARDEERAVGLGTHAVEALAKLGRVDDLLALAGNEKVDNDVRLHAAKLSGRLGRARDVVPSLLYLTTGPAARDAEAWNILGRGLSELERVPEQIEAYERALELEPRRAFTHNNLADALLQQGRMDEAAEHYRRRVELQPDNALNAYASLGAIAWSQGRREAAREHFAAALGVFERANVRTVQSPARLWENRALALLGLGRPKQAEEALRKALAARKPGERVEVDARWRLLQSARRQPEGLGDLISLIEEASEDVF